MKDKRYRRVSRCWAQRRSSCWRCIRPWSSRRYLIRRPPRLFPLSHVSISIPWDFSLFLSSLIFFSTKFTACICRDKRPWAWIRWTFAVLLKMVVKENYASRRLKRVSVEPFQLFEAIRNSEKERVERESLSLKSSRPVSCLLIKRRGKNDHVYCLSANTRVSSRQT